MKERLSINQEQRLQQRLSPLQVRYAQLLELNAPEAEEAVKRELEENPALEADEPQNVSLTDDGTPFNESAEQMQRADYASEEDVPFAQESLPRSILRNRTTSQSDYNPLANAADNSSTLYDYIIQYISERKLPSQVATAAIYIAGNIDNNGYLTRSLYQIGTDLAINEGIDLPHEILQQGLETIQSIEPAGIGAENLQQCLLLQLDRMPISVSVRDARRIVADYFEAFSMKHYHKIESALRMSHQRINTAISRILSLNPKPGATIGGSNGSESSASADFIVEENDRGELILSLPGNIPELHIEKSFEQAMQEIEQQQSLSSARRHKDNRFIQSRYGDARDFIRAIKMRRQTLMAVLTALVQLQSDYFQSRGDEHMLHPMALKDIAEKTGYDVSVISRATGGKYIYMPWGLKPMRFFFSERLGSGENEASARRIQAEIKKLIETEDKHHPLSDDALCKRLSDMGYSVSRRTTAKYRDRLGIPVARLRRQL